LYRYSMLTMLSIQEGDALFFSPRNPRAKNCVKTLITTAPVSHL
jgi:hypothetical protein